MSKITDEEVFPMPPVTFASLERLGEALLLELAPDVLDKPTPIDGIFLIRDVLPSHNIHVYPASSAELGDREGATTPSDGESGAEILIREDLFDALEFGGWQLPRARSTFAHELAHAVLHVRIVRMRKRRADRFGLALNRVARGKLQAFVDPEWQAFALGGCILAPRRTIMMLPDRSPQAVAQIFGISMPMATNHLRRLKLL